MAKRTRELSRQDVSDFEALVAQLTGVYEEMEKLAAKRPNDAINKFKLGIVNQLLRRANKLVGDLKPLEDFEQFSEDDLPSNSDVQVVLSQYLSSMEKMRSDNITQQLGNWYWLIDGRPSDIETIRPEKFFRR